MKSKKIMKYLLHTLLIFSISSACSVDFLETPPRDAYADRAFYINPTTAELAVNAIYNVIASEGIERYWVVEGSLLEERANLFGTIDGNIYNGAYRGINDANVALKYLPGIDFTGKEELQKRLIAEARALRAYYYYMLHMFLGPVPMIDRVLTYEEYSEVERPRDVNVTRKFIRDELIGAIPDLPSRPNTINGRVNKDFARFILAQIYMYDKNWVEAEKVLKDIINTGHYSLLSDYKLISSYDTKGDVASAFEYTSESIFEISLIEGMAGNYSASYNDRTTPLGCSGDDWRDLYRLMHLDVYSNIFLIEDKVVSHTVSQDTMWVHRETGNWITSPAGATVDMPVYHDDPRRVHTVLTFGDIMICPAKPEFYVTLDRNWYVDAGTRFMRRKYWPTSSTNYAGLRGNNFIMMRYAQVLLDYAEVQYRLGNNDLAYEYMNKVRERSWAGYPREMWERKSGDVLFPDARWNEVAYPILHEKGYDKTFIDLIHEYLLEFSYEAVSTQLMMRWGNRADLAVVFGYSPNNIYPERTWFGYRQAELDKNPKIWQNPGFEGAD
jgi:starch-binding outer membrane protein, SusD/RagB family